MTNNRCALLAMMLLGTVSTVAQTVIPDCGGLNQRTCTLFDTEFYANGSGACDRGLKIDIGRFLDASDDKCVNDRRSTLGKDASWVGWALAQQRYNIAKDEPVNFVTTLDAHNAYNNHTDGYLFPNQWYSITDLLNYGARSLEIDVHYKWGQLRVCHGDTSGLGCIATDRLYAYAIREISEWLDANPGEVIHIGFEEHEETEAPDHLINEPIKELLRGRFLIPDFFAHLPSIAELQAQGIQAVFTNAHNTHRGETMIPSDMGYGDRAAAADLDNCTGNGDAYWSGVSRDRSTFHWTRIYEGRAIGDDTEHLLYETEVAKAAKCGVGVISLSFLGALDKAGLGFQRLSPPDKRREAAVWSWREFDRGQGGNYAMFRGEDTRWQSADGTANLHYACAPARKGSPSAWTDLKGDLWVISAASGPWANGVNACQALGYEFSAPRNGYMNARLKAANTGNLNLWLNNTITPVQTVATIPTAVLFQVPLGATATIPDQTFRIYGVQGHRYQILPFPTWLKVTPVGGEIGAEGTAITVSLDTGVVAGFPLGSRSVNLTVVDLTDSSSTTIRVGLTISLPVAVSLASSPAPSQQGQAVTFTASLNYTPAVVDGGALLATGFISLRELVTEDGITEVHELGRLQVNSTAEGSGFPDNTVRFSMAGLHLGTYTVAAFFEGDSHYAPGLSPALSHSVKREALLKLTVTPAVTKWTQPVTMVVDFNSDNPPPSGSIKFFQKVPLLGGDLLGTAPIVDARATFVYSYLPVNDYPLYAVYDGDSTYLGATSNVVAHSVIVGTPVTITVDPWPATAGYYVDGMLYAGRQTFTWQAGDPHELAALDLAATTSKSSRLRFHLWSDGGAARHVVTAPSYDTTYRVHYIPQYQLQLFFPAALGRLDASPVSPDGFYDQGTPITVTATPNPGYMFAGFTGSLTGIRNPQILLIAAPSGITGNFVVAPSLLLTASVVSTSGPAGARVWTFRLSNTGSGGAGDVRITSLVVQPVQGTCTSPVVVTTPLPQIVGAVAPGGSVLAPVTIDFSGCMSLPHFKAVVSFDALGGSYHGSTTVYRYMNTW